MNELKVVGGEGDALELGVIVIDGGGGEERTESCVCMCHGTIFLKGKGLVNPVIVLALLKIIEEGGV